jgi:hypothetical protein
MPGLGGKAGEGRECLRLRGGSEGLGWILGPGTRLTYSLFHFLSLLRKLPNPTYGIHS